MPRFSPTLLEHARYVAEAILKNCRFVGTMPKVEALCIPQQAVFTKLTKVRYSSGIDLRLSFLNEYNFACHVVRTTKPSELRVVSPVQ